jgi:hypothetical protein
VREYVEHYQTERPHQGWGIGGLASGRHLKKKGRSF